MCDNSVNLGQSDFPWKRPKEEWGEVIHYKTLPLSDWKKYD